MSCRRCVASCSTLAVSESLLSARATDGTCAGVSVMSHTASGKPASWSASRCASGVTPTRAGPSQEGPDGELQDPVQRVVVELGQGGGIPGLTAAVQVSQLDGTADARGDRLRQLQHHLAVPCGEVQAPDACALGMAQHVQQVRRQGGGDDTGADVAQGSGVLVVSRHLERAIRAAPESMAARPPDARPLSSMHSSSREGLPRVAGRTCTPRRRDSGRRPGRGCRGAAAACVGAPPAAPRA